MGTSGATECIGGKSFSGQPARAGVSAAALASAAGRPHTVPCLQHAKVANPRFTLSTRRLCRVAAAVNADAESCSVGLRYSGMRRRGLAHGLAATGGSVNRWLTVVCNRKLLFLG